MPAAPAGLHHVTAIATGPQLASESASRFRFAGGGGIVDAIDEPLMQLGGPLKLPPWLEPTRDQNEHALSALKVPGPGEEIIMPSPPHTATT